jgi:hypothetical protein
MEGSFMFQERLERHRLWRFSFELVASLFFFLIGISNTSDATEVIWRLGAGGTVDFTKPVLVIDGNNKYGSLKNDPAISTKGSVGWRLNGSHELSIQCRFNWQMPYSTIIAENTCSFNYSYYFISSVPSLFVNGGVGYGFWFYPFAGSVWNNSYAANGFASSAGLGWEMNRQFELVSTFQFFCPGRKGSLGVYLFDPSTNQTVDQHYTQRYYVSSIEIGLNYLFR